MHSNGGRKERRKAAARQAGRQPAATTTTTTTTTTSYLSLPLSERNKFSPSDGGPARRAALVSRSWPSLLQRGAVAQKSTRLCRRRGLESWRAGQGWKREGELKAAAAAGFRQRARQRQAPFCALQKVPNWHKFQCHCRLAVALCLCLSVCECVCLFVLGQCVRVSLAIKARHHSPPALPSSSSSYAALSLSLA